MACQVHVYVVEALSQKKNVFSFFETSKPKVSYGSKMYMFWKKKIITFQNIKFCQLLNQGKYTNLYSFILE